MIPENSGLRPVAPPKEFQGGGGFGSFGGGGGGGSGRVFGGSGPPNNVQVEAPSAPLKRKF